MSPRSLICLMLVAGLATAAFADAQIAKVDGATKPKQVVEGEDEAGQRATKTNKDSGPDSWQFWGPQRQLLQDGAKGKPKAVNEAGQAMNGDSGPDSWQAFANMGNIARIMQEKEDGNEAGQRVNKDSGPNSWQFYGPNRQLKGTGALERPPAQKAVDEAGQRVNKDSGPNSWQFYGPNRQLLAEADKQNEKKSNSVIERAGNGRGGGGGHNGGSSGPNSWQFYAPVRQLLADKPAAAPQKPATKAKATPKQTAMKPAAAPQKPANKPEAAPKQTAMKPTQAPQATKKLEAAPKQQQGQQQAAPAQAPKVQPERGFRGWGWAGNSDMAGMPGGGNAYPLMNNRNIYTAAGWGGAPTTCAQGELAHSCATRKLLRKLLGMH